jgi:hypothetical protein
LDNYDGIDIRQKSVKRNTDSKYKKAIATRLQQLGWIKGEIRSRFTMPDGSKTEKTSIYTRPPQTATNTAPE